MLLSGLGLTVPFALGVGYQTFSATTRAAYEAGSGYPALVGIVGAFLAYTLGFIGPVGEGLLALGAFSALTVVTVGWNPLGVLRKREAASGVGDQVSGSEAAAAPPPAEPEPLPEDIFAA
ncbi:MAG TPA: hypothetical protein VMT77_04240, partial [Gemmatimonadales bacterium]|nr:hypothetical protein [Gemmatimonadales bacterium]